MLKIGIIGFGKMGRTRAKAIAASGLGEVICIWDVDVPANSPYTVASSDQDVLKHSEVDAVFVCTPNNLSLIHI